MKFLKNLVNIVKLNKQHILNNQMYFKNSTNPKLNDYIYSIGNRIENYKHDLRNETNKLFKNDSIMLTEMSEGELLKMLVKISNCKKAVEIGVFTGYSSLCIAEGLPKDGKLYAADVSSEYTNLAIKYWKIANVNDKIELSLDGGHSLLDKLISTNENIDFAYIDADKPSYMDYYEKLLTLMKTGGLIVFDNTLWSGRVIEETKEGDSSTIAIKELNEYLSKDSRVEINMLPFSDGITIVRKV